MVVELALLPAEDELMETEVLDWLDVVDAEEVRELLVEDEVVEAEVLDWLDEVGTDEDDEVVETEVLDWLEVVIEAEIGVGKADVVDGFLAQFDPTNSLLRLSA